QFNPSVISYVENILNFPAGTAVPAGFYDRSRARWTPSDNGVVIKLLGVTDDLADLDVEGNGVAASSATLAAIGIADPPRRTLAQLYAAGQSLWRVPISSLAPCDF